MSSQPKKGGTGKKQQNTVLTGAFPRARFSQTPPFQGFMGGPSDCLFQEKKMAVVVKRPGARGPFAGPFGKNSKKGGPTPLAFGVFGNRGEDGFPIINEARPTTRKKGGPGQGETLPHWGLCQVKGFSLWGKRRSGLSGQKNKTKENGRSPKRAFSGRSERKEKQTTVPEGLGCSKKKKPGAPPQPRVGPKEKFGPPEKLFTRGAPWALGKGGIVV